MQEFLRFVKDEDGASIVEYALLAALIAVAAITAMTAVGGKLTTLFNTLSTKLTTS
jgi:pilus assembly protein Flp/PilA